MAQEDVATKSNPLQRLSPAAWGVEREARAEEAEGRAEEFQGRLMGWLSGGPPPWWPAIDLEKLRPVEDVAGLEAAMLSAFGEPFRSIREQLAQIEATLAELQATVSKVETKVAKMK